MGSLLKTCVVVGFLLLLPAMVYCDRFVKLDLFMDTNCTKVPHQSLFSSSVAYNSTSNTPNTTFGVTPFNITQTFESAILTNVTGDVVSLVACQFGLECNATGAFQISFNLSDIGACSTAGPPGTQFDKFMISSDTPDSWGITSGEIVVLGSSISFGDFGMVQTLEFKL